MSLRQSRCSSQATENQFIICAPAAVMRTQAACCTVSLNVPEASVTTNTSKPSANADSVGNATQTSVTTPAMISCLRPVALIALTKSSLSQALIRPGRGMYGASGNISLSRSEEHTSELQSLMRISYAVFCLKKKNQITKTQ